MEERRLEGGRLLKEGKMSQAEIARHLGVVSRATVSDWAQMVKAKDIGGLRKKKAPGSQSKLSKVQKEKLKRMLDRGALRVDFQQIAGCWSECAI